MASDVFKVQSFDESSTDHYSGFAVRTVNPTSTPQICAMEYVFDANEEEQECCGCPITNDGLRTQTSDDLADNPSNGAPFENGIVKIVSSLPNSASVICNPALAPSLTPALRPSLVHAERLGGISGTSVQSFDDAPLDQTELNNLVNTCAFIHLNQSGAGICTCGQGDNFPASPHAGR
ncbi:MAG TPA: hypothetical protein VGR40_01650 [Candidatus Binatus sp.]|nr:hypothetical protein [Candidatus Binatus sp.]